MCRGAGLIPQSDSEVRLEGRDLTRDESDDSTERVAQIGLGAVDSWIDPALAQFMQVAAAQYRPRLHRISWRKIANFGGCGFDAATMSVGMAPSGAEVCDR